ncbi:MAG: hypothetical protein ACRDIU_07105 [Actinomycetota bacterium]
MEPAPDKLLKVYLNDHLALMIGSERLAGRCRSSNSGLTLAGYLQDLMGEIRTDVNTVRRILTSLDARESRVKVVLVKIGEKIGRLKLNGRLTGYSPLSRVVELQQLLLLRSATESLWSTLREVPDLPAVDPAKLQQGIETAREGQVKLHEHLVAAAGVAFGSRTGNTAARGTGP